MKRQVAQVLRTTFVLGFFLVCTAAGFHVQPFYGATAIYEDQPFLASFSVAAGGYDSSRFNAIVSYVDKTGATVFLGGLSGYGYSSWDTMSDTAKMSGISSPGVYELRLEGTVEHLGYFEYDNPQAIWGKPENFTTTTTITVYEQPLGDQDAALSNMDSSKDGQISVSNNGELLNGRTVKTFIHQPFTTGGQQVFLDRLTIRDRKSGDAPIYYVRLLGPSMDRLLARGQNVGKYHTEYRPGESDGVLILQANTKYWIVMEPDTVPPVSATFDATFDQLNYRSSLGWVAGETLLVTVDSGGYDWNIYWDPYIPPTTLTAASTVSPLFSISATPTVGYDAFPLVGAATKLPFDTSTAARWWAEGDAWVADRSVSRDGVDSVKAQTTDGQSTYREYTVTGPAVVDFWWKVSSEELYDTFSYSISGVNQQTISGEVDWTYRTLTLPEGSHTIRWTYAKDGSDSVGQDAGWLDDFAVYPATGTLQVRDGSTALDGEATVDFASADQGSAGLTKLLIFANEGYIPLEVQLSLPEGSPFAFEGGNTAYDVLLGRGETLNIPITLSGFARGTKTAQLIISAPDSTVVPPQIALLAEATLQVRDGTTVLSGTAAVDFGSSDYGSGGATKSLTVANIGYVPLDAELSLPEGSSFTFEGGAATRNVLLGRGEVLNIPITLIPAGRGPKSAQLTINAPGSASTPPEITLTGNVLGPVIAVGTGGSPVTSGQTIDLGLAPRTLQFTISNTGNVGNLEIAQISATGNFQIAEQPQASIAPQRSTTFTVLALGGASGVQSGTVTIASNDTFSETFTITLSSKSLFSIGEGIAAESVATSGTGGAVGWDFANIHGESSGEPLPSEQRGQALKTGTTPNNGSSTLEFTAQTVGVVSWTWKVSTQENFDWLLCEVDGQEVAGISTKNGVWQTQVVQVPAGANVRWVYRKDASGSAGEDAGYLADVEFRSLAANQSFGQWAQTHGISDTQQRMPKSGVQAMFGWLGMFGPDDPTGDKLDGIVAAAYQPIHASGRLTYRYLVSKTAAGTQQILHSSDMSAWTTRRISQRILSEDADRMVIEATATSRTKGFFKVVGSGDTSEIMVQVQGGTLPQTSELAGTAVETFQIGKTEVPWAEWQEVRLWAVANGYTDLAGIGSGSGPDHPVQLVNWYDVVKWSNAKSEMNGLSPVYRVAGAVYRTGQSEPTVISGNGYRLPTEAEWEWAARGGTRSQGYAFSGGDDLNAVANSSGVSNAVGTKAANELGVYDMSGNVYEWCLDNRVRGGAYYPVGGDEDYTVGSRGYLVGPDESYDGVGFRLARSLGL